jgi:hypothetical protein
LRNRVGEVFGLRGFTCSPNAIALPTNFDSWKRLSASQEGFGWQWELLRTFFANKGYSLYVSQGQYGLKAEVENDPANDSFGLLGVRIDFQPRPLLSDVRLILHIHTESYFVRNL